jgi:CRISPR/Cas system-associated exonuclease Cas4 (RecB family)
MSQIINIDSCENIINFTAGYIADSSNKLALISGGKRPFLFIKKQLANIKQAAFFSPECYTNDEFVESTIFDNTNLTKISDLEAAFVIFEIIKKYFPYLLKDKLSFVSFVDWSFEILYFIEQLDLEMVSGDKLKTIKANAEIGYDVPKSINELLKNIFQIRELFHETLDKTLKITKGYGFLKAVSFRASILSKGFDEIILITPFYLYKTELEIFKKLYNASNLSIFTQGDPKEYSILENLYRHFGQNIVSGKTKKSGYKLNIYSAFDDQSQGALLKNLIWQYSDKQLDETIVIVPDCQILQAVVSEISGVTDKYNIAAGYPISKTALYSLLDSVIEAQLSKKGDYYYSKDVIKTLTNPLFKNMRFFQDSSMSRIVVHKIEKALEESSGSSLSGKTFVSFQEILNDTDLIKEISFSVTKVLGQISNQNIVSILSEIWTSFFSSWENVDSLYLLSDAISTFLEKVYRLSATGSYPLNVETIDVLLSVSKEIKFGDLCKVKFDKQELFSLFRKIIKDKKVVLPGSPLKSLQILGLLESRNLSFENVFIVGMKDSSLPAIKRETSLIPKDIMYALGIEIIKKEYEIQKYHFNRIISGAKNVNLIYPDNDKDERSRFIESIIWEKQLAQKDINAINVSKFVLPKFSLTQSLKKKYSKTKEIKEYLAKIPYTYTKIDTYLNCRLKFYFMYVLLLDNNKEVGQEINASSIGNFIHDFLKEIFYDGLTSEDVQSTTFEKYFLDTLKNKFNDYASFKFREDAFMIQEVLVHRMKMFLHNEKSRQYRIFACEKGYTSDIVLKSNNTYTLESRIDRIDEFDNNYSIFDYKTGNVKANIVSRRYFENLKIFNRQDIKKAVTSLQLPMYKYIFEKSTGLKSFTYGIYDIKKANINLFPQEDEIYEKCLEIIKFLIDEINQEDYFEFDKNDSTNCKTCKYFYICK